MRGCLQPATLPTIVNKSVYISLPYISMSLYKAFLIYPLLTQQYYFPSFNFTWQGEIYKEK